MAGPCWRSLLGEQQRWPASPPAFRPAAERDETEGKQGGGAYGAAAALRLPPRALSVGGMTGNGVLRGRPGPRFTTGSVAAAAGGAGSVRPAGSAVATGSGVAPRTSAPERTARRKTPPSASSSSSWSAGERPSVWRRATGRGRPPPHL